MKKNNYFKDWIRSSAMMLFLCFGLTGWGQILFEENFDYPAGSLNGQNGWARHSGTDNQVQVVESTISYPGYLSSGTGNEVSYLSTNTEDLNKTFESQESGSIYASFLVNVESAHTSNGDYFFHLSTNPLNTSSFRGKVFVKPAEGGIQFGVSNAVNAGNYTTTVYDLNTTYLVVLKYNIDDATSQIYINPALNAEEPTTGWTAASDEATAISVGSVALRNGTYRSAFRIDGIRIATNWADIVGEPTTTDPGCTPPAAPTAEPQTFCGGVTVSDLVPVAGVNSEPSETTVVEEFTTDAPGGIFPDTFDFSSGSWTFQGEVYMVHQTTGGNQDLIYLFGASTEVTTPEFNGITSITISARNSAHSGAVQNLKVFKVVNGEETLVGEVGVQSSGSTGLFNYEIPVDAQENTRLIFRYGTSNSGQNVFNIYINSITFSTFSTSGSTVNWYDVSEEGEPLATGTTLATGTYYVSQTINGCESERTPVEVTVNETPDAPVIEGLDCEDIENTSEVEWAKRFGGTGADIGQAVATDASGNVYTTGSFSGTADFGDFSHTSAGNTDIFVVKSDPSGNVLWAKAFGSTDADVGYSVTTDADGNAYVTGKFAGTVNFGSTSLTAAGAEDIFVTKLQGATGDVLWTKAFGGSQGSTGIGSDIGYGIVIDSSGNVNVAGQFTGTADFGGTTLTSAGQQDIFVTKLDANFGNTIWAKRFGGSNLDISRGINVDPSGNLILTGHINGTVVFGDTTLTTTGPAEIVVAKINPSGEAVWAKALGRSETSSAAEGKAVATDTQGNVYITGQIIGESVFGDITVNTFGAHDAFIAKLSPEGTPLWVKPIGGMTGDFGYGIATNPSGNVYVTGTFVTQATIDDTVLTATGDNDIFLAEFDPSGTLVMAKALGGNGSDYGYGITVDSSGAVYATGRISSSGGAFDDIPLSSAGGNDVFVFKINGTGSCALTFCNGATIGDIAAEGTQIRWYESATATETLDLDTELVDGATYYVSQTVNECESIRKAITIRLNPTPEIPQAEPTQSFCDGATVADLVTTGTGTLVWYATETSEEALGMETLLESNTYYLSQKINDCESLRTAVEVLIKELPEAPSVSEITLCGVRRIQHLASYGNDLVWYNYSDSVSPLAADHLIETKVYYVARVADGCESERVPVEITMQAQEAPSVATLQYFCHQATVADLLVYVAPGAEIKWYNGLLSQTTLPEDHVLTNGTYYVTQTTEDCGESIKRAVVVRIVDKSAPSLPDQTVCDGTTVGDIPLPDASGSIEYKWYVSMTSQEVLSPETLLSSGTYYVSRAELGCETDRAAVRITFLPKPQAPVAPAEQSFASGATISDIEVTANGNVIWYRSEDDARRGRNPLGSQFPLSDGNTYYGVVTGANGCVSNAVAVRVSIALDNVDFDKARLVYYPNPVKDMLNIESSSLIESVKVYDITGKLLYVQTHHSDKIEVPFTGFSSGSYLLGIERNGQTEFVKIIKK